MLFITRIYIYIYIYCLPNGVKPQFSKNLHVLRWKAGFKHRLLHEYIQWANILLYKCKFLFSIWQNQHRGKFQTESNYYRLSFSLFSPLIQYWQENSLWHSKDSHQKINFGKVTKWYFMTIVFSKEFHSIWQIYTNF